MSVKTLVANHRSSSKDIYLRPFKPGYLEYYLTGDTWHYRDKIKEHGGVWDKFEHHWFIDEKGLDELMKELEEERKT